MSRFVSSAWRGADGGFWGTPVKGLGAPLRPYTSGFWGTSSAAKFEAIKWRVSGVNFWQKTHLFQHANVLRKPTVEGAWREGRRLDLS